MVTAEQDGKEGLAEAEKFAASRPKDEVAGIGEGVDARIVLLEARVSRGRVPSDEAEEDGENDKGALAHRRGGLGNREDAEGDAVGCGVECGALPAQRSLEAGALDIDAAFVLRRLLLLLHDLASALLLFAGGGGSSAGLVVGRR